MKKIYLLLFIFCLCSCKDDDLYNSPSPNDEAVTPKSPIGALPADSLFIKYNMQSNSELILSDRIVCKDSRFVLDLSPQEASELLIPNETYQKYVEIVEKMNKKSQSRLIN